MVLLDEICVCALRFTRTALFIFVFAFDIDCDTFCSPAGFFRSQSRSVLHSLRVVKSTLRNCNGGGRLKIVYQFWFRVPSLSYAHTHTHLDYLLCIHLCTMVICCVLVIGSARVSCIGINFTDLFAYDLSFLSFFNECIRILSYACGLTSHWTFRDDCMLLRDFI